MNTNRNNRKTKNGIRKLILVIISTFLSLALAEGFLRVIGFSFKMYPEKVQWGWPAEKEIKEMYRQDKELFWVQKDYDQKLAHFKKENPTAVFMGCSCTQFGQYDRMLHDIIVSKNPGKEFSYANFGVGGWSSYQGLQQLKRDVVQLKPKLVTIFYGWNDHWIGFGIEDKQVKEYNSSVLYWLQRFRLVQLVMQAVVKIEKKELLPERVSAVDFRKNLTEMVKIARRNNIIPVLLTAPQGHQKGKEPAFLATRWLRNLNDLIPIHQKYESIVREVAKNEKAVLCDLARKFEQLPKEDVVNKYFFADGTHPSREGDAVIADTLYHCLSEQGVLNQIWQ